ncbi:MAG: RNA polymerase sigma factor [Methylococcaceae bacterium]|nr:RNA polymerase sigma factor [Methylococcaceae bacterium]
MYKLSSDTALTLIEQHREDLRGFLLCRVKCPDITDDILQDTFIKLTQARTEIPIQNPKAFLYRVVNNLAIDYLRKRQREADFFTDDGLLSEVVDSTPSLERQVFSQEQIARLKLAISELPPRCRQVFILHKFKHYTYSQIMGELNIAESTVLKHIVKAMEHCRQRMEELDSD